MHIKINFVSEIRRKQTCSKELYRTYADITAQFTPGLDVIEGRQYHHRGAGYPKRREFAEEVYKETYLKTSKKFQNH